jgi:glycosyltransferase involved in cell wall biosynthesis
MNFPSLSVVIPVKDEKENLPTLLAEIFAVLEPLAESYEVIVVDDGSIDGTLALLENMAQCTPVLRYLSFDRNYGQTAAFLAGFRAALGPWIITLDGDGQNDPKDIPHLLALKNEADLVVGRRKKRKDSLTKRLISRVANAVRSRLCQDGVEDTGCSLKLFRKEALSGIKLFRGMHRFFPALFRMEGYRVVQVDVSHRPRLKGKSHYNIFNRSLNPIFDLFAVYWMRKRRVEPRIAKEG